MMGIPRSFQLAGHTFTVQRHPHTRDRGVKGEILHDQQVVYIADDVHDSTQHETFWHEVIEAINYTHELGLDHRAICTLGAGVDQVDKSRIGDIDAEPKPKPKPKPKPTTEPEETET